MHEDIRKVFLGNRDKVAVFHFAGHSSALELLLVSRTLGNEKLRATGFANFLDYHKEGLKLVFINGCANREQVENLQKTGDVAVIATSQAIIDTRASEFAARFYKSFASDASIETAFGEAESWFVEKGLAPRELYDPSRELEIAHSTDQGTFPWNLYGSDGAKAWKLSMGIGQRGNQPDPSAPTHLPHKTSAFFYPLRVGREVVKQRDDRDREAPIIEFPMWIENPARWRKHFQEEPAETVLKRWIGQPGIHPIVGEPGGGKTTLLTEWAHRVAAMSTPDKPILPFYIPLREVTKDGLTAYFAKPKDKGGYGLDVSAYLSDKPPHQTVWLFDGLDELPKDIRDDWLNIIANQKNHVCLVSCRTALYNSDFRSRFGQPHYLMGLYPKDQKGFLRQLRQAWHEQGKANFQGGPDGWEKVLQSKLQANAQLKRLAGSPLLLELIALTNPPSKEVKDLPANRVDFYRDAFEALLRTRTDLDPHDPMPDELTEFLAELSYEVNRNELVAEIPKRTFRKFAKQLSEASRNLLMQSGILKAMEDGSFQWLHLTFQEWLLAEYLHEQSDLLTIVERYWSNAKYDETLSLLWGLASEKERFEATVYLIEQGRSLNDAG